MWGRKLHGLVGVVVTFTLLFWAGFMWYGGGYMGEDVYEMKDAKFSMCDYVCGRWSDMAVNVKRKSK